MNPNNKDGMRQCNQCHEIKPLDDFHKSKDRYLNREYRCKICSLKRQRPRPLRWQQMTAEQKSKRKESAKKHRQSEKGRVVWLIQAYKRIDKSKSMNCEITRTWFMDNIFNHPCIYCGDYERIGCDRIDNSIGHTPENVVPCCADCNVSRMNRFTFNEMLVIGRAIRKVKVARGMSPELVCMS